jgi:RNA polymerase sigma-70 factor (sigma-E family)
MPPPRNKISGPFVRPGVHDVADPAPTQPQPATTRTGGGGGGDGPADALEALYREQYEPSVRLAHLLTGDRGRAEELAQDAFVRIAPRLDGVDNPAGYLRTALVNLCRDAGRRTARAKEHPTPIARVAPEPAVPTSSTAVWAALQRLPERQRVAVTLRYYLDLPDDEIAEHLGARPATVRSLVHRALATLQEAVPHE